MNGPRFFVHLAAPTVEDMLDASARHGVFVNARTYLPPSGRGIYGSVEVVPHDTEEETIES